MSKVLAVLVLSAVGTASAMADGGGWKGPSFDHDGPSFKRFAAPEIDPSSAISALTLLCGGLTVLRGRIAKK